MKTDASIFFDKFAVTFDTFYDGKRNALMQLIDRNFRKDIFLRFTYTFDSFGNLKNKTLIDIGCGSGIYLLEALKRNAKHITGLDPAAEMLKLTEARLSRNGFIDKFRLIESIFPATNLGKYDYAIVMGVMDYIKDSSTFLKELKNIINESACVSFPSKHWFRTPFRKFRYSLRKCPVYFFDENEIKNLAKSAGFSKVMIKKIQGAGMDYHVTLTP
jgi:cyclopropane fatty-acyl-phospholipid synthase-like methyltransferase